MERLNSRVREREWSMFTWPRRERQQLSGVGLAMVCVLASQAGSLGQRQWAFATGDGVSSSPAIGADGTVYVGSWDGKVYAVDGLTGEQKWAFVTGGEIHSSPAIGADGTVYVGSSDGRVYALNGATGARQWEFPTSRRVTASPAIGADGTVYVGSHDWSVYALEGSTGDQNWTFETGAPVHSSVAIGAEGTVYVGAADGVFALDGATGSRTWFSGTHDRVWASPALGVDGTVYVGSWDGNLYALDGATGVPRWAFFTGRGGFDSSPAIGVDGTVYVGSWDGRVYAVGGATGLLRWAFQTGESVYSSPAIDEEGTVYVGAGNQFYALDGATGSPNWTFVLPAQTYLESSPALSASGSVYVGAGDGVLYALRGAAGPAISPWPKFRQNARNMGRLDLTPRIRRQPSRLVFKEGASGQISVTVASLLPLTLNWFRNNRSLPEEHAATLTIPSVTRDAEGFYTLVASNAAGRVTSQPILALVSNVEPQPFLELQWQGGSGAPVRLESAVELGLPSAWHLYGSYPSSSATRRYVDLNVSETARFFRLRSDRPPRFASVGRVNGWWMAEPIGTCLRFEVTSAATGWTNWQVLTNLALPVSPYLFLDQASLGAQDLVYRTTISSCNPR